MGQPTCMLRFAEGGILTSHAPCTGHKVGGQPMVPFQSIEIKDGEVIELADGKKYTVKYEDEGGKPSSPQPQMRWGAALASAVHAGVRSHAPGN